MVSVECSTASGVMSWFDLQESYNFVIYRGIKEGFVSCHYDGNNKDEAENRLHNFCASIEPQNDNIYYLKLQSSGKTKEKTILPGLIFRLNSAPKFAPAFNYPAQSSSHDNEILSRLAAIENNLQNDVDDDEQEETTEQNLIGTLLNEPSIKNLLISGIGSILANILTPALPSSPVVALAGIEETTENLQQYITTLFTKGVTIADLKTLSEKSEIELNFLLSILRK